MHLLQPWDGGERLKILEKSEKRGSKIFILVGGVILLGRGGVILVGSFWKRFASFSYLNYSFILSLNVKVCIRFDVFFQISLFLFVKSYVG